MSHLSRLRLLTPLAGLGFAAGCASVGDRLTNPPIDVASATPATPDKYKAGQATDEAPEGDWLAQFNDPVMTRLVKESLEANPGLRASAATVKAARFAKRAVYGRAALPSVDLSLSGGLATTGIAGFSGPVERSIDPQYQINVVASWEIDLWGRLSARIAAAQADVLASDADLAAAELSVAAQTAIAWIDLNAARGQERVALADVAARDRVLYLTERRFARGLSTALDVRTARTALLNAEASVAAQQLAAENAARRLDILLGRYPTAEIEASGTIADLTPIAPAGDPISLLARRPDIAAQEARVIAAGLRAEEARLALRPAINISGRANNTTTSLADLIDPELFFANIAGGLAQPVFQGGALEADRDAAYARAEAALATYADQALTAWREVEDALAADDLLELQVEAQARALEEAVLAEELALRQYENGLVAIFNLLQAQTTRLNAESALIQTRANRASNRISYHLALGGGVPVAPDQAQQTGAAGGNDLT